MWTSEIEEAGRMTECQCIYPEGMIERRWNQGPVAIIECNQNIACNPCAAICPQKAVKMDKISDIPKVNYDLCNGCGLCMSICPGLAIFNINMKYSETSALLKIPYEMLPLPEVGKWVNGYDRCGTYIGRYQVKNVREERKNSFTYIVSLEVPKKDVMCVRSIRIEA